MRAGGRRPSSVVRRAARWLALALALAASCTDTHVLTGVFHSGTGPDTPAPITLAAVPGFEAAYVEMVLGHYGPDVAGTLRFYRDKDFLEAFPESQLCPCRYISRGSFDKDALTFTFPWPIPPCTDDPDRLVTVRLDMLRDGDQLSGEFRLAGQADTPVTFVRKRDDVPDDPSCEGL